MYALNKQQQINRITILQNLSKHKNPALLRHSTITSPWKGLHWNLFNRLHRFTKNSTTILHTSINKKNNLIVHDTNQSWSLTSHTNITKTLTNFDDDNEPELVRTHKNKPNGPDTLIIHRL